MSDGGTNYVKLKLILELLGRAKRITDAGYHIRFVPAAYEYPGDYLETRNKE